MTTHEIRTSDPATNDEICSPSELEPRAFHPRIYVTRRTNDRRERPRRAWLNADRPANELTDALAMMLEVDTTPGNWAIRAQRDFAGIRIDPYEDLGLVALIGQNVARHGEAFASWVQVVGHDPRELARFECAYQGNYPNTAAYAAQLLGKLGVAAELDQLVRDHLGERLHSYVRWDYEAFCRDLGVTGELIGQPRRDGSVDVFQGDFL